MIFCLKEFASQIAAMKFIPPFVIDQWDKDKGYATGESPGKENEYKN